MFTFETNKTMYGKRDKHFPIKALLGTEVIARGVNKTETEHAARQVIQSAYFAAQAPMVIRHANDGSVFVARWTGSETMEYVISRPNRPESFCSGQCKQSLQSYMDGIVKQYNETLA